MLTIDLARAKVAPGARVLDIGCGGGRHAFACLKAGADVIAVDLDRREVSSVAAMVEEMRKADEIDAVVHAGPSVADVLALPFPDDSFDVVIASEVLEHLVDDNRAIAELARVLRRGGTLALSVPRAGPELLNWTLSRQYHNSPGGHVRIYRRRVLRARLKAVDLRVMFSHHCHGLHSPYWWLRCAIGLSRESNPLVLAYHRFLVWDIVRRPGLTRALDAVLNPLIGKSLVYYCEQN